MPTSNGRRTTQNPWFILWMGGYTKVQFGISYFFLIYTCYYGGFFLLCFFNIMLKFSEFVCVCGTCTCLCMYMPLNSLGCCSLLRCHLPVLETKSLITLELPKQARLALQKSPGSACLCLFSTGLPAHSTMFLCEFWGLSLGRGSYLEGRYFFH